MAKTKSLKKGEKNIFYRLLMAVMAIAVPVSAYFADLLRVIIHSDALKIIAALTGEKGDTGDTLSVWSIHRFTQEILPMLDGKESNSGTLWVALEPIHTPLICVAVFFCLAIVLAVVILGFSVFSRKKTIPLCLSVAGILSMIGWYISFTAVATPFTDGTISLAAFFNNSLVSSIFGILVNAAAEFKVIRLGSGFFIILFLFIGMALWAGANKLIELDDKKPRKQK